MFGKMPKNEALVRYTSFDNFFQLNVVEPARADDEENANFGSFENFPEPYKHFLKTHANQFENFTRKFYYENIYKNFYQTTKQPIIIKTSDQASKCHLLPDGSFIYVEQFSIFGYKDLENDKFVELEKQPIATSLTITHFTADHVGTVTPKLISHKMYAINKEHCDILFKDFTEKDKYIVCRYNQNIKTEIFLNKILSAQHENPCFEEFKTLIADKKILAILRQNAIAHQWFDAFNLLVEAANKNDKTNFEIIYKTLLQLHYFLTAKNTFFSILQVGLTDTIITSDFADSFQYNVVEPAYREGDIKTVIRDLPAISPTVFKDGDQLFKYPEPSDDEDEQTALNVEANLEFFNKFSEPYKTFVTKHAHQSEFVQFTQSFYRNNIKLKGEINVNDSDITNAATYYLLADGGFIFVEQFNIFGYSKFSRSIEDQDQAIKLKQPIATSLTITHFTLDDEGKIIPKLLSHKMYALDKAHSDVLFQENLKSHVLPRYNQSAEKIKEEIENETNFYLACNCLEVVIQNEIKKNPTDSLSMSAKNTLHNAGLAKTNNEVKPEELPKLTNFLNSMTKVINAKPTFSQKGKFFVNDSSKSDDYITATRQPTAINEFNDAISTYSKNLEKISSINRWKRIAGAGAIFLGAALAVLSIAVAVASFGFATPLSAMGLALSGSLILAGVAVGAGIGVGVLTAGVGTLFTVKTAQKDIYKSGIDFEEEAKKTVNLKII